MKHHYHDIEYSGRYRLVKELGAGTFGCVLLAKDLKTGELVAVKQMEREYVNRHYVGSEITNHSVLHHPHVVAFKEVFLAPHTINIAMEYVPGGSLLEFVQARRRLGQPLARWFFQQMIISVDYCHRKGIVNRDIKLDNLLLHEVPGLSRPLLKVCDFGYSKSDERGPVYARVGTLSYIAPEVLTSQSGYDARKADVWSCGVALYVMLAGRYPFEAPAHGAPPREAALGVSKMLAQMHGWQHRVPEGLALSPGCLYLLQRLLEPDPRARITVPEILKDPWFSQDLPPNALAMNAACLELGPACRQTRARIAAIVDAIRADSDDECLDSVVLDD